jgi:ATP-binding cassette subfamily C protein CydC
MSPLFRIYRLIWREERAALARGLLLSVAVLVAGGLLLGLSGWFITAAGAAGLAGIGIAFDVFRPSAGVRLLALGRTAARYGERVLTHDATLRALARLRVRLLERLADQDAATLARLRSPAMLNRVTADVDALDGIAIRLVFPLLAGAVTLALAYGLLAWLVTPVIAALVVGMLAGGAGLVLLGPGRAAIAPAAAAEGARQGLRTAAIEHLRMRTALAFAGALPAARAEVLALEAEARGQERRLAALDRRAGALASGATLLAAAGALLVGGLWALEGAIAPALAAIAVFAALALGEVLAPLQRGVAEIGRMRDAAGRVAPMLDARPAGVDLDTTEAVGEAPALRLSGLCVAAPGSDRPLLPPIELRLAAGEALALTGRSGQGKSTLLSVIAGLARPLSGRVEIAGRPVESLPERELRRRLGYLPQRSQLVSGTIRSNLGLAAPDATDAEMAAILEALGLTGALAPRGGLDMVLGEGGAGLSGGEARRVALARVLLRRPEVVLLDEPTEGLDAATAAQVLAAIRTALPQAAILIATHRRAEVAACDTWLTL